MSGCYYLCTELTLSLVELFENCIYLNQSELSNFFTYIIIKEPKTRLEKCEKHSPAAQASPHLSRVLKNSQVPI